MAGLNLGAMGGVKASIGSGFSSPNASTATEAAFGQGYSQTGAPSVSAALAPNDPFGMAFWAGVASLGLLILIRHSLPA